MKNQYKNGIYLGIIAVAMVLIVIVGSLLT